MEEDRFVFDQDIQLLQLVKMLGYTGGNRELVLPREFKDTWNYSLGLEFQLTHWLSVMMGYERRPSSVADYHFDNIYSLPDLDNYGAGFSIKLKDGTQIDLGFAYLLSEKYVVPDNGSDLMNSTDPFKPVYNPYAGLDYHQKTETFIASFKLSMPLEVMSAMMEHTLAMLNPFSKGEKKPEGTIRPKIAHERTGGTGVPAPAGPARGRRRRRRCRAE